jgi:hypothetical protein
MNIRRLLWQPSMELEADIKPVVWAEKDDEAWDLF